LRAAPAFVVLHDTVIHHLLVEEAALDENWTRFAAELRQAYGADGAALAEARRWGYTARLDPFLFPARQVLLRYARGVIVHSELGMKEVQRDCPEVPVRHVPLPVGVLPGAERRGWRERLGVGENELLLVHLGFLTREKGLLVILKALASLRELGVAFRLVIAGEGVESDAVLRLLSETGLASCVRLWGYASEEELGGIVSAADVGLVPRYPTAGETSAAVLRFLAMGVPVFLAGYRQFLEFPTDAAFRIAPGEAGVVDLVRGLVHLSENRQARRSASAAARRAWEQGGHQPAVGAIALLSALREMRDELAI
jgi:glycosyltransferase involved in cell wall biosynthesis